MFDLNTILRPHILTLTPYSSARDEYTGKEGIFLDANENPFGSVVSDSTLDDSETEAYYNRYPDPHQYAIKERLAPIKSVRPTQIFIGNGSDEPIDLLVRATCTPGQDSILIVPPTYGMYEVSAAINDVQLIKVPLKPDFQLDVPAILAAIQPRTKLLFVCSPNNPTGNLIDRSDVLTLLDNFNGLVVVDEAYIDFASTPSFTTLLDQYPNLVVLQTFSKAWGLAALRSGMCFASEALIEVLNKIKPPYNVSGPTQQLLLKALNNVSIKDAMVTRILAQREELTQNLLNLPLVRHVYPSDANFLLVKFDDPKAIFDYLIGQQIIVRDRHRVKLCEGCLRITVGTESENRQVLSMLQTYADQISTTV
ncbi:histidinol-phosphate aminotransferase [Larkinella arboricola]|uniref:Histidinol-phosphate aminotransferase n=1 Tax=Larkinella arboricola TaxID=643671 RepID=A0A327WR74_LARAB|nr:histidinol-phosphate transaminase [Larkinella arboricola]RAJ94446.1 histidinol-phosphate aminotransferase [Larkinella arboricola]